MYSRICVVGVLKAVLLVEGVEHENFDSLFEGLVEIDYTYQGGVNFLSESGEMFHNRESFESRQYDDDGHHPPSNPKTQWKELKLVRFGELSKKYSKLTFILVDALRISAQ